MPRAYESPERDRQAEETRRRIVEAARDLLLSGGYRTMTIASLAKTAGVSPQTVYNSIGGKAAVVKAVYDVLLAGDFEPVPMSSRPEFEAMRSAPDRAELLAAYARLTRRIHLGVGPLLAQIMYAGVGSDEIVADLVETIETERRTGNGHMVAMLEEAHGLPEGWTRERVVDVVWTLTSPEVADRLLRRCGWSGARYEEWLARSLQAHLA